MKNGINISEIINDKNGKKNLRTYFNKTEEVQTVYTLTKAIRSKIVNHEEFIKTLHTKKILDNTNNFFCNFTTSPFTDPNDGNILTGDIRVKELLCQGPRNREPATINLPNCKTEIKISLSKCSSDCCNKKGVSFKCFTPWISLVMEKFIKEIKELKNKFKFSRVKQVLEDPKVIYYLNILQEQNVMSPVGKVAYNISFNVRNIKSKYS